MTIPMFGPPQKVRPGQSAAPSFLNRMQEEVYAARGSGADTPLISETGPSGTTFGIERLTLDLVRFVLTEDLVAGGHAAANTLFYDNETRQWTVQGESITVYDSLSERADGTIRLKEGQYGFAKWFSDNGLWEIVNSSTLNTDDFFPAKLTSHSGTSPVVYAWTEMEYTSEIAFATVLSGGRTGTISPACWRATELNNNSVANDTIVWMRRQFIADPAVAVLTKTLAGNGAGTHATFSLYVDDATGGTYTLTWDGHTSAAIAFNASSATTKAAIQAITGGPTLSAFSGAGTLASPWTFSVTSDANDHNAATDATTLKNGDGFRFDMGGASDFEPCLADPLPDATGSYKVVVQQTDDNCLALMEVTPCTSPVFIDGGLTS